LAMTPVAICEGAFTVNLLAVTELVGTDEG
jgi:hypothetical protein